MNLILSLYFVSSWLIHYNISKINQTLGLESNYIALKLGEINSFGVFLFYILSFLYSISLLTTKIIDNRRNVMACN